MEPLSFKAAGGIRNIVSPERLARTDLVAAMNIDLDESGAVMRRRGVSKLINGATHSLFALDESGLAVQGGALKQFFPNGTSETLRSGITGARVSYASVINTVYWSDETQCGVFDNGVCRAWGVVPPPVPTVTQNIGALPAGRYSVVATYMRGDGHESGARESLQVDLVGNSGLLVALTPSTDSTVVAHRIYLTTADGDTLYAFGEYPASALTAQLSSAVEPVLPLRTQFMGPPPAGQLVALHAGVLYIAKDNFLIYTLPYEYELVDLRFGFVPFDDRITMVAPVSNGIFVGTTKKVVFLQGVTPGEFKSNDVYGYGVVEGTALITTADSVLKDAQPDPCAVWLSTDGFCIGQAIGQSNNLTGQVKNLTAEKYVMNVTAQTGASVLKLRDGTPHFVVSTS